MKNDRFYLTRDNHPIRVQKSAKCCFVIFLKKCSNVQKFEKKNVQSPSHLQLPRKITKFFFFSFSFSYLFFKINNSWFRAVDSGQRIVRGRWRIADCGLSRRRQQSFWHFFLVILATKLAPIYSGFSHLLKKSMIWKIEKNELTWLIIW